MQVSPHKAPIHIAIACLLCLAASAHAAVEMSAAVFGFDGSMIGNRANCITVDVNADSELFQGYVSVEYAFENSAIERKLVPFSATPGVTARVPVLITPLEQLYSFMGSTHKFTIELRTINNRLVERTVYSTNASTREVSINPPLKKSGHALLLCGAVPRSLLELDIEELEEQIDADSQEDSATDEAFSPDELQIRLEEMYGSPLEIRCTTTGLPRLAKGYEAIDAAVMDSCVLNDADPSQLTALRQWVRSGGHLYILLDCLDDRQTNVFPQLANISAAEFRLALQSTEAPPIPGWHAREAYGVRIISTLTGLGLLQVLDRNTVANADLLKDAAFWKSVLVHSIEEPESQPEDRVSYGYQNNNPVIWPGAALLEGVAGIRGTLKVPPFWPLAIALAALSLIIGPVLALAIRRKPIARFSWLLTAAILVIASAGAWIFPSMVRTENTWTTSATLIDASIENGSPTAVTQTSMLILGSGETKSYTPTAAVPGRWRTVHPDYGSHSRASFPILQTPLDDQHQRFRAQVWTIEPLLFESTATEPAQSALKPSIPICSVTMDPSGMITATASPAPSTSITGARVFHINLGERNLIEQADGATRAYSAEPRTEPSTPNDIDALTTRAPFSSSFYFYEDGSSNPSLSIEQFAGVPDVARRARSMSAALATGEHALITLRVSQEASPIRVDGVTDNQQEVFYRLLVPVTKLAQGAAQ